MERIGVAELRQNASRYLALVKNGQTVEVTERGKLVALLSPVEPARTALERLVADGAVLPPSNPSNPSNPGARVWPMLEPPVGWPGSDTLLNELREDRV